MVVLWGPGVVQQQNSSSGSGADIQCQIFILSAGVATDAFANERTGRQGPVMAAATAALMYLAHFTHPGVL